MIVDVVIEDDVIVGDAGAALADVTRRDGECRDRGGHHLSVQALICTTCGMTFEELDAAAWRTEGKSDVPLPPSDHGLDGAIPLDAEWRPALTDEGWHAQNRRINDLLMGRVG